MIEIEAFLKRAHGEADNAAVRMALTNAAELRLSAALEIQHSLIISLCAITEICERLKGVPPPKRGE